MSLAIRCARAATEASRFSVTRPAEFETARLVVNCEELTAHLKTIDTPASETYFRKILEAAGLEPPPD